jgi:hypothetical protein
MNQELQTAQTRKTPKIQPVPAADQDVYDAAHLGAAIARHGDLMFAKSALPDDAKALTTKELLRSTVTGHVHGVEGQAVIYSGKAQRATGSGHYVVVTGPARAGMHLEHKPITLPRGTYEVLRKREQHEDFTAAVMD